MELKLYIAEGRRRRYSAPSGESGLSIPLQDLGLKLWHWLLTRDASNPGRPCAVAQLPVEVLQAIFIHYQHSHQQDDSLQMDGCRKVAIVPVTLGSVCFHWRQVTLTIPALWSRLWVSMPRKDDTKFLDLWLQRSGSHHPLDLRFDETPLSNSPYAPDLNCIQLLKAASHHASRWRHLRIHLWQTKEDFLQVVPPLQLLSLESISMRTSRSWTSSNLYRSLYAAPNLTTLRFHGDQLNNIEVADAPWQQIVTVEFESRINWDVLASILARSCSLRHLSINKVDFDGIFHVASGSIVLPTLRRLHLGPHLLQPAEFFGSLTLPGLLEIGFNRTFGYQFHDGYTAIAGLVDRSECHLQSFEWFEPSGNVGLPPQDLVLHSLVATGPNFLDYLTTLKITSPVRDVHLKALARRRSLPCLETISLEQCWSTDGVLSDMVLSRAARLKSVSVVLYGSGIILDPKFTRDLSLKLDSDVHLDIRKG
ncbi:hypothetical protein BKA70DRAFT_1215013 [Coprinopsis sp. MPI-PUGE-AT-0042]|nr:hypothetical protein BKA70DRAFT_1215013 [Coprinopsis sp. MPI-PUGE-AT-0042]